MTFSEAILLKSLPLAYSQGGVEDEISLSAYITIALLEMSLPDTVSSSFHLQ